MQLKLTLTFFATISHWQPVFHLFSHPYTSFRCPYFPGFSFSLSICVSLPEMYKLYSIICVFIYLFKGRYVHLSQMYDPRMCTYLGLLGRPDSGYTWLKLGGHCGHTQLIANYTCTVLISIVHLGMYVYIKPNFLGPFSLSFFVGQFIRI